MSYEKLVRDNIPDIIIKNGEKPIMHIAEDKEYEDALKQKLHEEVAEFLDKPSAEEAADILEVLHAICALKQVDLSKLEEIRQIKAEQRGGFSKRIILDGAE